MKSLCEVHDHLTAAQLGEGFYLNGQRYPLVNPRRGIFKPVQMRFLLSVNTVFPKSGNRVWYDDQREVHRQIFDGDEMVDYAFMGDNPDSADNRWLREAFENNVPIVYFLGNRPGPIPGNHAGLSSAGWDPMLRRARHRVRPAGAAKSGSANDRDRAAIRFKGGQAAPPSGVLPRGGDRRLSRPVALSGLPGAPCCLTLRTSSRTGTSCWDNPSAQRHPAFEDPSRRLRRPSHRDRSGLPAARVRAGCSARTTALCSKRSKDWMGGCSVCRRAAKTAQIEIVWLCGLSDLRLQPNASDYFGGVAYDTEKSELVASGSHGEDAPSSAWWSLYKARSGAWFRGRGRPRWRHRLRDGLIPRRGSGLVGTKRQSSRRKAFWRHAGLGTQ